jgi:hypothetical protein
VKHLTGMIIFSSLSFSSLSIYISVCVLFFIEEEEEEEEGFFCLSREKVKFDEEGKKKNSRAVKLYNNKPLFVFYDKSEERIKYA